MLIDAAQVTDGATLEADICIVGAGVAGLVLAHELALRGREVLLLESGTATPDARASALNEGLVLGDAYAGLRETRERLIGGTAALWNTPVARDLGAKYAPLDPIDLSGRFSSELGGGWPFSWAELSPWYERAQPACGLGRFEYDRPVAPAPPFAGPGPLVARCYHLGSRAALVDTRVRALCRAANVRMCSGATAVTAAFTRGGERVATLGVIGAGGNRWTARASIFVFAGGAVENARLLLSIAEEGGQRSAAHPLAGRCFMEHPRDDTLTFVPRRASFYREASFLDVHDGGAGHLLLGRLGIDAEILDRDGLLNASLTFLPIVRGGAALGRSLVGALGSRRAVARLLPAGGHGWSSHPLPRGVYEGFVLRLNVEQTPHVENRIVLGSDRDALGVRRPVLHWRWRAEDADRLDRLRATVARAIEGAGVGRVVRRSAPLDPNAHHHAGTTRMHADPRFGVVDANARVHGVENLFVAGASVFPTAGFANPVLTIVALTLRLAHHLS